MRNARHFLPRKTWRRRLRIRVRGLILLVLIIGVGLGWIVNGGRVQREAVAAIGRDGGVVSYDWDLKAGKWNGWSWETDGRPGVPKWLLECLGVDYFDHVVSVAHGLTGSNSACVTIGQLGHVERLGLHGPFVTDAGLAHLKGLTNLSSLNIGDREEDYTGNITLLGTAHVTDAGMPYLKGLTKLSLLDLNGTKVSDAGLIYLAGLTKLQVSLPRRYAGHRRRARPPGRDDKTHGSRPWRHDNQRRGARRSEDSD